MEKVFIGPLRKRCPFRGIRLIAAPLFADLRVALRGAEHQERCGIGAIIPPTLPSWIGEFVCEIQCALPTLLTLYTTVPELPDYEGIDVRDFVRIE
jgi:hypothetical protein